MQPHDKLFTPGPVEVSPKTWAAFSRPMISHRGDDFKNLYRAIHLGLQKLFNTNQPVFLSTSSAWGVMEASIRNLVGRGVVNCMCGAFSDKWFDVAKRCGKNAEPLQVDWGKHIDHKAVDRHLATGKFDTVTLVHNETSTGVMNPLGEICGVLAKYPDVVLILDTVSSFSGIKIDMDALGIDVMLTGAQKALALPPGFSLFSVSEKGFARAEKIPNRGFYFDFLEFKKQQKKWVTQTKRQLRVCCTVLMIVCESVLLSWLSDRNKSVTQELGTWFRALFIFEGSKSNPISPVNTRSSAGHRVCS